MGVLLDNNVSRATESYLVPLLVSKAVSAEAFDASIEYYEQGLGGASQMSVDERGVRGASFKLAGATVQVRLTSRPDRVPAALSVRELEVGKRAAHARFVASPLCGFDKLMDTHVGWDHFSNEPTEKMERYLRYFDKNGYRYHVWGSYAGGTPNVYAEDPTGDTVQIDANWDRLPVGAADDALMNQCSQGNCSGSVSSACGAALQGRCGSTTAAGLSMLCYDCTSQHFGALVAAGCVARMILGLCG